MTNLGGGDAGGFAGGEGGGGVAGGGAGCGAGGSKCSGADGAAGGGEGGDEGWQPRTYTSGASPVSCAPVGSEPSPPHQASHALSGLEESQRALEVKLQQLRLKSNSLFWNTRTVNFIASQLHRHW